MSDTIATDNPFTADEERTLVALVGAVIPASAEFGTPGRTIPPSLPIFSPPPVPTTPLLPVL